MSWIQENRFAAGLGGFTAVAAIGLIAWSVSQNSAYSKAKEEYDTVAAEVSGMEGSRLYPSEQHVRDKKKAVTDYREGVEKLQKSFDSYRPGELAVVDPAAFTEELKKVKGDIDKALTEAKVEVPQQFYMGFEAYTNAPVRKEATGVLGYELNAFAELFQSLAAAKVTKIDNVFRDRLEEETGQTFDTKDKSFRSLPIEITFTGTEESVRSFLSAIAGSKSHYYVIRTLKVMNSEQKAPTAATAQFEKPEEAAAPADSGVGEFVLPPADGAPAPEAGAAPAAPVSDDSKILQQVLGSEKVHVFLRIDALQFLASRELPKS